MKKFFLTESERNRIKSLYQKKGILIEEEDDVIEYDYGKLSYTDGNEYEGNYIVYKSGYKHAHGYGTMKYKNGDTYTGDWVDMKKSGYGTMKFKNGDTYIGDWVDGMMTGYGTYTYKDGKTFQGEWKYDIQNGYGTETLTNGKVYYQGNWVNGRIEGWGVMNDQLGTYKGNFKDGKRNGYGTNTKDDGSVQEGNWVNDEFQGGGETTNGETTNGETTNGETTNGNDGSEESTNNCEELRVLAEKESVYNICNLQSGKVVIGLRSQGPLVKYIQCILNQQETELGELFLDGIFGAKTKEKVEKFQKNNEGLIVDGIVGQKTFEKFNLTTDC